jgi:hypothetical protein
MNSQTEIVCECSGKVNISGYKPKKNYGNPTYENQRRTMVILLIKTKEELWFS